MSRLESAPDFILAATSATWMKPLLVASGFFAGLTWNSSINFVGMPLNFLFGGMIGSILGVLYGDPLPGGRKRQFTVVLVNAFFGGAFSTLVSSAPHMGWLKNAPGAAFALASCFLGRWWIPAVIEKTGPLIREYLDRVLSRLRGAPKPPGDGA